MVVGAGRGPLVRSAFNASTNVNRKIKMYVIEKNPNAIVTLAALQEEMWSDKGIEILQVKNTFEKMCSTACFHFVLYTQI